jgi:hypothetical protein
LVLALEGSFEKRPTADLKRWRLLIREMSAANPLWGAPRIHGELMMLGIKVAQSTVAKYMARGRRPPRQSWKTFLRNHAAGIAAANFLVVPAIRCPSHRSAPDRHKAVLSDNRSRR